MLDLETLLAPIEENAPAGPDLEYDAEWQALERLAQGKPEQQFGDTIIPAEEPDWGDVSGRAIALLGRSKDLRSATLLAIAQTRLQQLPGLSQGLQLVHQLLERYWESVHPILDASDNDDPTMRLNAISALADPQGLLRVARAARLSTSRGHELTLRQVEVAAGKATAREGEAVLTPSQVEQQIRAMVSEDPAFAPLVADTFAAAKALSSLLDERVGSDRSLDFKPLVGALYLLNQHVSKAAESLGGATDPGAEGFADGSDGGGGGRWDGPGINTGGTLRSRQDVVVLLDKISEFLQRTEPTNPVPLILARAKRLMEMNFIELLQEIAPDGLVQAKNVTGIRDE